jgi:hypothetical protein
MKIQVVRQDGRHETLTLTEPLTLVRGERQNTLVTQTGMEHFFTQEGRYDGWGMPVGGIAVPANQEGFNHIKEFIDAVENDRDIEC